MKPNLLDFFLLSLGLGVSKFTKIYHCFLLEVIFLGLWSMLSSFLSLTGGRGPAAPLAHGCAVVSVSFVATILSPLKCPGPLTKVSVSYMDRFISELSVVTLDLYIYPSASTVLS